MLTIKQPTNCGSRLAHDLPTPPSTSRASPPLALQESGQKSLPAVFDNQRRPDQSMSGHQHSLPPPGGMTFGQQGPTVPQPQTGPPSVAPLGQGPPLSHQTQAQVPGQLPPPPLWQQVSEESMRSYLEAKTQEEKRKQEEEKRKQEEEKRKQEEERTRQRKLEHDILQTSLQGGIPPSMIPVVFAGMAGRDLSQAVVEQAQQFMLPQGQQSHPPQPVPPGTLQPSSHPHESQAQQQGSHPGVIIASTSVPAQGPPGAYFPPYPGPPARSRGLSMSGALGGPTGGSNLLTMDPNIHPGPRGGGGVQQHTSMSSVQRPEEQRGAPTFLHWTPPMTQAGAQEGSREAASYPGAESPQRKRKAIGGAQEATSQVTRQRLRSPPFQSSNLPRRRGGGHLRQRSDIGIYDQTTPVSGFSASPTHTARLGPTRDAVSGEPSSGEIGIYRHTAPVSGISAPSARTPGLGPTREGDGGDPSSSSQQQRVHQSRPSTSVSSLLADDEPPPPQTIQYPPVTSTAAASHSDDRTIGPQRSEDQAGGD